MKQFKYKAKKGPGETIEGTLQAETQEDALDKINGMGLVPVDLDEVVKGEKSAELLKTVTGSKVKSRSLLTFYRQLGKMIKAGVPILKCLTFSAEQTEDEVLKRILADLEQRIREGDLMSDALKRYPDVFSHYDIAMIQMGEAVGKLEESVVRIADFRQGQAELYSKIRGALAYPAFILIAGIATVAFLLAVVIPQFSRFFEDLQQQLPLITRVLVAFSQWMQGGGIWIFLVIFAGVIAVITKKKTEQEKRLWDSFVFKVPLVGKLMLKFEVARIARALESLVRSGIPILNAVRISLPVIGNEVVRQDIQVCYETLEEGGGISEGLKKSSIIPPMVHQLISVGEESGHLDESLSEIADWYEQETTEAIRIMTQLLEPAVILVIGSILGLMIIAILLPIFSINAMVQ